MRFQSRSCNLSRLKRAIFVWKYFSNNTGRVLTKSSCGCVWGKMLKIVSKPQTPSTLIHLRRELLNLMRKIVIYLEAINRCGWFPGRDSRPGWKHNHLAMSEICSYNEWVALECVWSRGARCAPAVGVLASSVLAARAAPARFYHIGLHAPSTWLVSSFKHY